MCQPLPVIRTHWHLWTLQMPATHLVASRTARESTMTPFSQWDQKAPPGSHQGNFTDLQQYCPATWQRGKNSLVLRGHRATELQVHHLQPSRWGRKNNLLVSGFLVFGYCLTCSGEHSTNRGRTGLAGCLNSPTAWGEVTAHRSLPGRPRSLPATPDHQAALHKSVSHKKVWKPS